MAFMKQQAISIGGNQELMLPQFLYPWRNQLRFRSSRGNEPADDFDLLTIMDYLPCQRGAFVINHDHAVNAVERPFQ